MRFVTSCETGAITHDRQGPQPVAPAHDRRHDGPSFQGEGPEDYIRHVKNFRPTPRPARIFAFTATIGEDGEDKTLIPRNYTSKPNLLNIGMLIEIGPKCRCKALSDLVHGHCVTSVQHFHAENCVL